MVDITMLSGRKTGQVLLNIAKVLAKALSEYAAGSLEVKSLRAGKR